MCKETMIKKIYITYIYNNIHAFMYVYYRTQSLNVHSLTRPLTKSMYVYMHRKKTLLVSIERKGCNYKRTNLLSFSLNMSNRVRREARLRKFYKFKLFKRQRLPPGQFLFTCVFRVLSRSFQNFAHMAEFKTPTRIKAKSRVTDNAELCTPVKIPASPFLQQIGYGTGIAVYMLERSPKVGSVRSPWAIKKWMKGKSNDVNNSYLRLEANILRRLNHPNVVGFRAFTTGPDGKPCLAMEALDTSLGDKIEGRRDLLEDEPFPVKDIMRVAFEVAKGLKYLHLTAHILHGDIKSWNILVSHDFNVVKICDFGNSLPLTESLEVDMSKGDFSYLGTQCWNPPEVINENGPVTSAADIWPYGLLLWEMISLSVPHAEHLDESETFVESLTESIIDELDESNVDMNESDSFLKEIMPRMRSVYGMRPALPAIDLGKEYENILEVFFICTTSDYKLRPSARALVNYFERYANIKEK